MIVLNEEDESFKDIKDKWLEESFNVTLKTLPEFLRHLTEDYKYDYGTICHAMSIAAIATLTAIDKSPQGGITGFQASAVMWAFIRNWQYTGNKTGLRIVDFDDMLYPQYEFQKIITKEIWESLQLEANRLLTENKMVASKIRDHWQSIADGKIPFGYTLPNEEN